MIYYAQIKKVKRKEASVMEKVVLGRSIGLAVGVLVGLVIAVPLHEPGPQGPGGI